MKKKYIIPTSKSIILSSESVIALSASVGGEEDHEVMTQKEDRSSIWDNWKVDDN